MNVCNARRFLCENIIQLIIAFISFPSWANKIWLTLIRKTIANLNHLRQSKFMTLTQDEQLKIQIKVNSSNLLLKILIICILILLSVKMLRWNWEISSLTRPLSCQLRKCIKETNRRLFPETTSKYYMTHNHFSRFHTSNFLFLYALNEISPITFY